MDKTSTGKSINQKQGPRTGNAGYGTKREDFMAEKSKTSSNRADLARMVTDALETRGRDNRSHRAPGVESLHDTTNAGRGPTKGNAGRKGK
jgi:hypothetical protein